MGLVCGCSPSFGLSVWLIEILKSSSLSPWRYKRNDSATMGTRRLRVSSCTVLRYVCVSVGTGAGGGFPPNTALRAGYSIVPGTCGPGCTRNTQCQPLFVCSCCRSISLRHRAASTQLQASLCGQRLWLASETVPKPGRAELQLQARRLARPWGTESP